MPTAAAMGKGAGEAVDHARDETAEKAGRAATGRRPGDRARTPAIDWSRTEREILLIADVDNIYSRNLKFEFK